MLITGASRGIGKALALAYCRMGANVFVTSRKENKLKDVRTYGSASSHPDGSLVILWY